MKVAAGVLAASLLFFLGVMTGAGRRESAPPPVAIPLGAVSPAGQGAGKAPTPTSPPTRQPGGGAAKTTTSTSAATPPPTDPSSTATTATTAATAPAPDPAAPDSTAPPTTSTTARSGDVEQVDSQVDCARAGRRGRDRREPCSSTTTTDTGTTPTTTGDGRGGGGDR